MNAKNELKELLESLGTTLQNSARFDRAPGPEGWESTVTVWAPGAGPVIGRGHGRRKTVADVAACEQVMPQLRGLSADWARLRRDAQAGDALVKLAAYLAEELGSAEGASTWLQACETNARLAAVFDRWHANGADELAHYGPSLGRVQKATVMEAVFWRRYGGRVLGHGAEHLLAELRVELSPPEQNHREAPSLVA